MKRRNDSGEAHGEEKGSPKWAETGSRETRRKKGNNDEDPEQRYGRKVEKARVRVAGEGIVNGSKERRDDHKRDADVV